MPYHTAAELEDHLEKGVHPGGSTVKSHVMEERRSAASNVAGVIHAPKFAADRSRRAMRLIVMDSDGNHLPGAVVYYFWDGQQARIDVGDFDPDITVAEGAKEVRFVGHYPNAKDVAVTAKATDAAPILQFTDVVRPSEAPVSLAVTAGLILAATCVVAFLVK
jgi:hypothetical protein